MIRLVAILFAMVVALPLRAEVDIQEVTSPGGIKAWLVEESSIPFVALDIRFRGGASLDEPGKRGAVALMTSTLEEGAADMDAREFARREEALAASFGYDFGDDSVSVSARFLTENAGRGRGASARVARRAEFRGGRGRAGAPAASVESSGPTARTRAPSRAGPSIGWPMAATIPMARRPMARPKAFRHSPAKIWSPRTATSSQRIGS